MIDYLSIDKTDYMLTWEPNNLLKESDYHTAGSWADIAYVMFTESAYISLGSIYWTEIEEWRIKGQS